MFQVTSDDVTVTFPILDELAEDPFSPVTPSQPLKSFPADAQLAQSMSAASFGTPVASPLWEADQVPTKVVVNSSATRILVISERSGSVQVVGADDAEATLAIVGTLCFRAQQDDSTRAMWLSCLRPDGTSMELAPSAPSFSDGSLLHATPSSTDFTIFSPATKRSRGAFVTVPASDVCLMQDDRRVNDEMIAMLSTRFSVGFFESESLRPVVATGAIFESPAGRIACTPDGRSVVAVAAVGGNIACVTLIPPASSAELTGNNCEPTFRVLLVTLRIDSATVISALTVSEGKDEGCWMVFAANYERNALIRLEGRSVAADPVVLTEKPHVTMCVEESYRREDNAAFSLLLTAASGWVSLENEISNLRSAFAKEPAVAIAHSPLLEPFGLPLHPTDDGDCLVGGERWLALAYPSAVLVVDPAFMDGMNVIDVIENSNDRWFTCCQWADVGGSLNLIVTKSDASCWIYAYRRVEAIRSAGRAASMCLRRVLVDVIFAADHGASFVHCSAVKAIVAVAPSADSAALSASRPHVSLFRCAAEGEMDLVGVVLEFDDHEPPSAHRGSGSLGNVRHAYLAEVSGQAVVVSVHDNGACCTGVLGGESCEVVEVAATPPKSPAASAVLLFVNRVDKTRCVAIGHENGDVGVWVNKTQAARVSAHSRPVTFLQALQSDAFECDLVSMSVLGGSVVFHRRDTFAPFLQLQSPTAPLTAVYWDSATDAAMLVSGDCANLYDAPAGRLDYCVDDRAVISTFGVGRVNLCRGHHKPLKLPCTVGRVLCAQQDAYAVNIKLGPLLEVLGDRESDSGEKSIVPAAALPALAFLLPRNVTEALDSVRALLQLPIEPYPRVAPTSLQTMFGIDRKQSALHLLVLLATLRLLEGFPVVADAATAAIQSLLGNVIDAMAKSGSGLCMPCIVTCVSMLAKDQPALQFAGRNVIHATVRTLTEQEVATLLRQVDSAPPGLGQMDAATPGAAERAKHMLLFSKVTLVVHALRCHAKVVDHAAIADVVELVEQSVLAPAAAASSSSAAAFLSSIADGWSVLSPHFTNCNDLLLTLFDQYCVKQDISNFAEYRTNAGAKALTTIAALDLEKFFDLCETKVFKTIEWRPSFLTLVTRLIQTYPGKMMPWFPRVLGFVWKAIDPHSPRKAEREKCFAPVGVLFRLAVHALPNVAFHQAQQRLCVGHVDGHVSIFDVKSTTLLSKFQSHSASIACVAYSVVDNIIAVVSVALDEIRFWRPQTSGNLFLSFLSGASDYQHFVVAASIPIAKSPAMDQDLAKYPKQQVPLDVVVRKCRLTWLSPSCVELSTPWHNKEHVHVSLRMA